MSIPAGTGICKKFNLFDLHKEDLKKFLEFVDNEKVCVISVIGKSSLSSSRFKMSIIGEALDRNLYESDNDEASPSKAHVTGYLDTKSKLVFLNLHEVTDTSFILDICKKMEEELKTKSLLEIWADLQYDYAKVLLLLFNLSHIVIVVHPNSSFDMSYVFLFQVLNKIRVRSLPWFTEQLKSFDISPDWVQAGRPCSPRVLFVFESCPLYSSDKQSLNAEEATKQLKDLGHSLEDQIYRILRKTRVITNVSSNSLFAIPANQEFVYVFFKKSYISDPSDFFMTQLLLHCRLAKENDGSSTKLSTNYSGSFANNLDNGIVDCYGSENENIDTSFKSFLQQHIKLALTKGFDDNMGLHPAPAFFELPFVHTWFELASKLSKGLLFDSRERGFLSSLKNALDVDLRFSDGRCRKVLPIASGAYQENLPIHYTEKFHKSKLSQALQVFSVHARGPACRRYAQQLTEDCQRFWKNGHQMCEVLSLTGNHCINVKHRTEDDLEDKTLQVLPHCSQVKIVSACNCGRKQATREDPFTVKAANYDFYQSQFSHCCNELETVKFPVFQASTSEPFPAHISPVHTTKEMTTEEDDDVDDKVKEEISVDNDSIQCDNASKADQLSAANSEGSLLAPEEEQPTADDQSQSPTDEAQDEIIISIQEEESVPHKDKVLTRQPSTTEYLPGMLHSNSPPGLLPLFSSWWLINVGPSSLYSHNIGLQDQPGFLQGTNFLLPWDVTVKVEHKERWPALWEGKRPIGIKGKKTSRDGPQFNVKIFIGVEYECFRGHRFMCSSPDRVLRTTSSGMIKDNALKVTGSDMPLYFPCPCRPSKPLIAQMMRIHVVTPKAPVHVTLNPRVQPAPDPCPIFFPTINEPLKLSQAAYWILRLPFAYVSEQTTCYPPREPVPVEFCRLLKGTYNIAEHPSIR